MIHLQNVFFSYKDTNAISNVHLKIEPRQLLAVVGGNGAGKSTLLNLIGGFIKPSKGTITRKENLKIAYLPQQSRLDREFPLRVQDVLTMGLWQENGLFGNISPEQKQRINNVMESLGLLELRKRSLNTLSGGQFQRVLFGRMMIQNADIMLLDEPFNALDEPTINQLLGIIKSWHKEGKTVIAVLHDLDIVREHFPQTVLIAREIIAQDDTVKVLTPEKLASAAFGKVNAL